MVVNDTQTTSSNAHSCRRSDSTDKKTNSRKKILKFFFVLQSAS
jgi:hypothetical protein